VGNWPLSRTNGTSYSNYKGINHENTRKQERSANLSHALVLATKVIRQASFPLLFVYFVYFVVLSSPFE